MRCHVSVGSPAEGEREAPRDVRVEEQRGGVQLVADEDVGGHRDGPTQLRTRHDLHVPRERGDRRRRHDRASRRRGEQHPGVQCQIRDCEEGCRLDVAAASEREGEAPGEHRVHRHLCLGPWEPEDRRASELRAICDADRGDRPCLFCHVLEVPGRKQRSGSLRHHELLDVCAKVSRVPLLRRALEHHGGSGAVEDSSFVDEVGALPLLERVEALRDHPLVPLPLEHVAPALLPRLVIGREAAGPASGPEVAEVGVAPGAFVRPDFDVVPDLLLGRVDEGVQVEPLHDPVHHLAASSLKHPALHHVCFALLREHPHPRGSHPGRHLQTHHAPAAGTATVEERRVVRHEVGHLGREDRDNVDGHLSREVLRLVKGRHVPVERAARVHGSCARGRPRTYQLRPHLAPRDHHALTGGPAPTRRRRRPVAHDAVGHAGEACGVCLVPGDFRGRVGRA
mmetsp:Transcript_30477/g.72478  ORF Transcript_30477/g.72478 Transcript_30477/m.72478 type:complete len:453 (-) Transcript_30477:2853-4211(-)